MRNSADAHSRTVWPKEISTHGNYTPVDTMNSGNLQMRFPSDSLQLNLKYELFQDPSLHHKK